MPREHPDHPDPPPGYVRQSLHILGPWRFRLPPMVIAFVAAAALDLLGLGLIMPFVSLVSGELPADAWWLAALRDRLGISGDQEILTVVGLMLIGLFTLKGGMAFWVQRRILRFSYDLQADLRLRLLRGYQAAPYTFHMHNNSADLINRMLSHVSQFSKGVVGSALRIASEGLSVCVIVALLIWADWVATAAVLVVLALTALAYDRLVRARLRSYGEEVARASEDIIRSAREAILGLKEIRILGRESYFQHRTAQAAATLARANTHVAALNVAPRYMIEIVLVTSLVLLTLIMVSRTPSDQAALPILGLFAAAGLRLMPSANQILTSVASLRYSSSFVRELYRDLVATEGLEPTSPAPAAAAVAFKTLRFESVSYRYPDATHSAVADLSFSLDRGEALGLIGASGAGKSTVVDLLLGLIPPSDGVIRLDGTDIQKSLRRWQAQTAYIPQSPILIDDSVRRNIALGVPDPEIDPDRLAESLRIAQLTTVVEGLPAGLDTAIGEGGLRLSGGQRQRIALARALYHHRDVVVMDEATSALDEATEQDIVAALQALKGRLTLVVIAHRPSTVRVCDVVHRLVDGRLADSAPTAGVAAVAGGLQRV